MSTQKAEIANIIASLTTQIENDKINQMTEKLCESTIAKETDPQVRTMAYVFRRKGNGFALKKAASSTKYSLAFENEIYDLKLDTTTKTTAFTPMLASCKTSVADLKKKYAKTEHFLSFVYIVDLCIDPDFVQFLMFFDSEEKLAKVEKILRTNRNYIDGTVHLEYKWVSDIPLAKIRDLRSE